jgi:hypothetical protein
MHQRVIEIDEDDDGLTARALLVLAVDVGELTEKIERIKAQVRALAKRHPVTSRSLALAIVPWRGPVVDC